MSPEDVLRSAGVPFVVHAHAPVSTVAEILQALPFPSEEHVKTLALDADGAIALAGLRGSDRIAYGKLARALGVARDRISQLPPERVLAELGMAPGGVCPITDRQGVRVVVDERVLGLARAFCGSGRQDATLELAPADLVRAAGAAIADLAADAP